MTINTERKEMGFAKLAKPVSFVVIVPLNLAARLCP